MLRELFCLCLPLLGHSPAPGGLKFRLLNDADYSWAARLVKWGEDQYFRQNKEYGGKVIGLTADTLTVRLGTRIPRTFSLTPALLSENLPFQHGPGMGYRLRDVRLGDLVDLDVTVNASGLVCYGIGIFRRPGGVIPPGDDPPDIPENSRRHHLYNKLQTAEEVGLTLAQLGLRLVR